MKTNINGLLGGAARCLTKSDGGRAYALYALADHLKLLMRGEVTVEEFKAAYVGEGSAPFIRDGFMPGERDYPGARRAEGPEP